MVNCFGKSKGLGYGFGKAMLTGGVTTFSITTHSTFVKYFIKLDKSKLGVYTRFMAILPSVNNKTTKRELTDKQKTFLEQLVETQGDAKKAAELAGYTSHYHHVVKTLKSEILDLTQEILANSAPKAAFKLVEIMTSNKPIVQAANKLTAAQTLLDRVGVVKVDKVDVNHTMTSGGIFLMPDKTPVVIDAEDADYETMDN